MADFPGDPGPGVVLSGCTVWSGSAGVPSGIDWIDTATGRRHVLSRTYSTNANGWDWGQIDADLAVDRIPFHTSKFTAFTAAQIAAGAADPQLDTQAASAIARAPSPIWLGFYHEPEDNFESDAAAAEFRDAARHIVAHMRTAGVTNVAWVFPVWMTSWSFRGGEAVRGGAWKWDIDWKGTLSGIDIPNATDWWTGVDAMTDVIGMDQYTPWIGGTTYNTFDSDVGYSVNRLFNEWGRPVKPIAIGECGTKDDASPTPDWNAHFADLLTVCITDDVRGLVYYNTDANNFVNADPTGLRFAGYNAMIQDALVGDVDTPGVPAGGGGEPVAPSFVGASTGGGGGLISHTVPWPAGVMDKDFAVLLWTYSTTQTSLLPAGFVSRQIFDADSGSHRTELLTRICDGTESGNVSIELVGITKQNATLTVYRGLHATTPLDTWTVHNATGGTSHNCPAVTTGFADCVIASGYSERVTDASANMTPPSGYTERADAGGLSSAGGGGTTTAFADDGLAVSRLSGTIVTPPNWTGTTSTANAVAWTLSLRPLDAAPEAFAASTAIGLTLSLDGATTMQAGSSTTFGLELDVDNTDTMQVAAVGALGLTLDAGGTTAKHVPADTSLGLALGTSGDTDIRVSSATDLGLVLALSGTAEIGAVEIAAFGVYGLTGPGVVASPTITGSASARTITGPGFARMITGTGIAQPDVTDGTVPPPDCTGPGIAHEEVTGPAFSRTLTGSGV